MKEESTFCIPTHCQDVIKKDCQRWIGNIVPTLNSQDRLIIPVSDFSIDENEEPIEDCMHYLSLGE
jgi:hypothetical protein